MNLAQINAFNAVAKLGSFSRAAEYLHISQPAVSQHIKAFEETVGSRLFLREGRQIILTDSGLDIMHSVSQIVSSINDLEFKISGKLNLEPGPITIGLSSHYFMQLIAVFIEKFPKIELYIEFGNTAEMYQLLYNFKVDVAFLTQTELNNSFFNHTFYRQQIIACVPKDHPWAEKGRIAFEEFCSAPIILREKGSQTRSIFDLEVKKRGQKVPDPILTVKSREILKESVAAGIGVGYVFDVEFGEDSRIRPVWFEDADLSANQTLACLKNRENSQLFKELLRIVDSHRFPALEMANPVNNKLQLL